MKGIISRDGRYVARPTYAGKKHWLGTFDNLEDAEAAIVKWRGQGRISDGRESTVTEIVRIYGDQCYGRLSPSSVDNYRRALASFAATFGPRQVRTLRRIEIQTWANTVPADYLRTARTLFEWSRGMDIVTENPTRGVSPRPAAKRHRPTILTAAQVDALADAAFEIHDEPEAIIVAAHIRFAAASGMRPGELAALRWADIDYAADEIIVKGSITIGSVEKAPKNGHERRIVLTPPARAALATLDPGLPDQRIFELPCGQLLVKATHARYFDPVRRHAGLAGFRFYDLRHTCATALLEMGAASYVVAIQLGHSDGGRLVENTYGHPSTQDALDKIKQITRVATHGQSPALTVAGKVAKAGDAA